MVDLAFRIVAFGEDEANELYLVGENATIQRIVRAEASISGRVLTPSGLGLRNAVVNLTDSLGQRRTATSSSFGVYQFDGVATGQTYTLSVASKRYRFAARVQDVSGQITDLDFTGLE